MRAGRRFGVILNGKNRQLAVRQSLDRIVVQIQMSDVDRALERIRINGEAVILRRDLDFPGRQIHDRLVAAVMAEL